MAPRLRGGWPRILGAIHFSIFRKLHRFLGLYSVLSSLVPGVLWESDQVEEEWSFTSTFPMPHGVYRGRFAFILMPHLPSSISIVLPLGLGYVLLAVLRKAAACWLTVVQSVVNVKARLHGSPRLINAVDSTKVNRVNSSFQRKWSTGLTVSFNVVDSLGWLTTDYPCKQASHDLFPSVARVVLVCV